jgi:hypothetical protein
MMKQDVRWIVWVQSSELFPGRTTVDLIDAPLFLVGGRVSILTLARHFFWPNALPSFMEVRVWKSGYFPFLSQLAAFAHGDMSVEMLLLLVTPWVSPKLVTTGR